MHPPGIALEFGRNDARGYPHLNVVNYNNLRKNLREIAIIVVEHRGFSRSIVGVENPSDSELGTQMLSMRLVQLIEANWEEIANRTAKAVKNNTNLPTLSRQPEADLRDWCQGILENLGQLLAAPKNEEIQKRFHGLGRIRYEEQIPLHEAVLRFQILKDKIIGFVHEQGFPMTAVQLYSEEELAQRMGRFFDACVYNVVRGYEEALRRSARMAS